MRNPHRIALPAVDPQEKRRLENRKINEKMKFCPDCQRIWERVSAAGSNCHRKIEYYAGMPTLGKTHELCPACKIKNDELFTKAVGDN